MNWQPIKTFNLSDREEVDLWLHIYASPRSMGISDSFRVIDAYRKEDKWFHRVESGHEKELYSAYITHWMMRPGPPVHVPGVGATA